MSNVPSAISIEGARAMLLHAQGIEPGARKPATKAAIRASIQRMGQLQIDTISVANRSPYLVLYARTGPFPLVWLEQLLAAGKIFEAWSHEACFLPIEDYRFAAARFQYEGERPWRKRNRAYLEKHRELADQLIERIRTSGPVRSADFERVEPRNGEWWADRKHEKLVLEGLFADGQVMIVRRENFQRVYGLREMVLPDWEPHHAATEEETDDFEVEKAIFALGVATRGWIADYYRMRVSSAMQALGRLQERGIVHETQIAGLGKAYVHARNLGLARKAARGKLDVTRTVLLSPFDPVVWHRQRASELFGFDYRIECYTPAEKRIYGYFTLPILHRGKLVGRLDPKAHRTAGIFEVKALHLEPGFEPDPRFVAELAGTLTGFAEWHGTPEVRITSTNPVDFREPFLRALDTYADARIQSGPGAAPNSVDGSGSI